jgi:hypothetical protein
VISQPKRSLYFTAQAEWVGEFLQIDARRSWADVGSNCVRFLIGSSASRRSMGDGGGRNPWEVEVEVEVEERRR